MSEKLLTLGPKTGTGKDHLSELLTSKILCVNRVLAMVYEKKFCIMRKNSITYIFLRKNTFFDILDTFLNI